MGISRDWWNDAGQSSTSTVGFIGQDELAACAVVASNIAAGTITACEIASCAIETAKVGSEAITSCKISDNALARMVVIPFPKLTTTAAGGALSSTYSLMVPLTPLNIQGVQIVTQAAWEQATCDHFVLFRNSSACVADVGFRSIASTAPALGAVSCVGTVTNALVAAGTLLTMKSFVSTCSVSAAANLVISYISTQ
jgi:hypothetical protein